MHEYAYHESYKHDSTHNSAYWIERAVNRVDGIYVGSRRFGQLTPDDLNAAILFLNYARTAMLADAVSVN